MEDVTPAPERWLPVPDWEDLYEVSNHGRARSLRRRLILKPSYSNKGGYPLVILYRNGEKKGKYIHQLAMEAFVGPCPPGMETRHLDGNPLNNRWAPGNEEETVAAGGNLIYGTKSDNMQDTLRHGTHYLAGRDHCDNGHELTEDNTWIEYDEDGTFKARRCKACNRDRSTKQRAKRKTDERRCKEEDCGKPYFALDWCSMHYGRWYRAQKAKGDASGAA